MPTLHRLFSVLFLASLSLTGIVAPFWDNSAHAAYNTPVSGAAGGDLSGTYPNPTVATIGGKTPGSAAFVNRSQIVTLKAEGRNNQFWSDLGSNGSTDVGATIRQSFTTKGAITKLQLHIRGTRGTTSEQPGYNSVIDRASVEYNGFVINFTVAGNTTWTVDPNAYDQTTDILGVSIPANTQYWIRFFSRVSSPPTSPTATPTAGGSLAASTQYFYKLATVDNGIEGAPSVEFTGTTTGSNLSNALAWTAPTVSVPSLYYLYRGTTTNAETLVAQLPGNATGYLDAGANQVTSSKVPQAAQKIVWGRYLQAGDSSNSPYIGGNGTDQTGATGAITGSTGPNGAASPGTFIVAADDLTSNPRCLVGDSIGAGTGILQNYNPTYNDFDQAITNGQQNTINVSDPGSKMVDILGAFAKSRLSWLGLCDYVILAEGHNDIFNGTTWTAVATYDLQVAQVLSLSGKRVVLETLTPSVTSTTNFTDTNNQTYQNTTNETNRENYNTWVRAGSPVSAGVPVLTGGTASPYIFTYFDKAAPVEVNQSNALTPNAGYWIVPAATYTGQVLTGTPTVTSLTVSTANYPIAVNGLRTYAIKMTSGAANGQTALISANTATTLTLYANGTASFTGTGATFPGLTTAPAAGDTFSLYALPTPDGVHPSQQGYTLIAPSESTFLNTTLTPF